MSPKVSIVTITYNSSQFVRQAIESVLAQSFTDIEYIISDDCSSDNTWDIIQEYKDPRIRAWRNPRNLGEYPNRNKTLNEAKGEFIIWIDGDDIFYPHGLEFMVKMLEAFPNSAMACARPYWANMVYPYELKPEETFKHEFLGSQVTINGFPDTLIKTSVLKETGGLPEDYISGDTFVKRQIALQHNILLISNGVSWWRTYEGQASSKVRNTDRGYLENIRSSLYFLNHKDLPLTNEERETGLKNIYAGFARYLLRRHVLRGRLVRCLKLVKNTDLKWKLILRNVLTPIYLPMLNQRSAQNPYMLPIKRNPYV